MLKVNRKVEYGLVALKHMQAKPADQLTSVREICDQYGTPFDPLAHVMRLLSTARLVESEQGAHGGYRLIGDLSRYNVAEFIELIDGQLALTECIKPDDECRCALVDRCNIVSPMHTFHNHLIRFLRSISVHELLQDASPFSAVSPKKLATTTIAPAPQQAIAAQSD
jgi:Rrf2 family transcriptional regulator, nitric oxide-sensitive transcriptional repressor